MADVLFGDYNPSGKLPVTFYKNVEQLPDFENYDMANRTYRYFTGKPLFPFGYGLSYTTFEYSNPTLVANNGEYTVTVDVTNTGKVAGAEIAQIYVPLGELVDIEKENVETIYLLIKEIKDEVKILSDVLKSINEKIKNHWITSDVFIN